MSHESSPPLLQPWQFFLVAGMLGATVTVIAATGQRPASIVILSLTVVAAAFAGLGLFRTLLPLVSPEHAQTPRLLGGRTRAALEREKALVLRSIKELEFDHAMGKVSKGDFDEMGGRLRGRAIRLLEQLESGGGYRTLIERELQARLGRPPLSTARQVNGEIEPAVPVAAEGAGDEPEWTTDADAAVEETGPEPAEHACATCGVINDPDARFCKGCGARLSLAGA